MRSSKSRSRSKSNRQRSSMGNIVNRVFDSSGPEGKVRGTPQQIIDKYLTLARDAQLGNDRVAAENFLQHAEHYARMLSEAQREMEAARQRQGGGDQDQPQQRADGDDQGGRREERGDRRDDRREDGREERRDDRDNRRNRRRPQTASDVIDIQDDDGPGLVETPEMRGNATEAEEPSVAEAEAEAKPKPRRGRKPKPDPAAPEQPSEAAE